MRTGQEQYQIRTKQDQKLFSSVLTGSEPGIQVKTYSINLTKLSVSKQGFKQLGPDNTKIK